MLKVHELHTYYGSAHVLHGVSLEVKSGQIVCLVGRNGAGKSTTLKSIMGVVRSTQGNVMFCGEAIERRTPHAIAARGIAWVPEDRRVFGSLTVEENIRVAAQATRRSNRSRIGEALAFFPDLVPRAEQLAASLSGGQQQMLAIARGLASNPQLMLLDEPTEGLAPSMVQAIRNGILQCRAQGVSMLLVEQNFRLALSVGDLFYVLSRGSVVFAGTRDEILASPEVVGGYLGIGKAKELSQWAK